MVLLRLGGELDRLFVAPLFDGFSSLLLELFGLSIVWVVGEKILAPEEGCQSNSHKNK